MTRSTPPRSFLPFGAPASALLLVAASVVGGDASAATTSEPLTNPERAVGVSLQVCLPDRKAIVEETTVDVTDIPANLSQREWQDLLLKATVLGRYDKSEAAQRALVTIRTARPAEGSSAAESWLGVGQVAIRRGVGSDGASSLPLADSTGLDQAVYQTISSMQPGEILAVSVRRHLELGGKKETITFWFNPPQRLSPSGYTEWQAPVFQEGERDPRTPAMRDLLFEGKALPTGAVDNLAPRIRYTLMSWDEYMRDAPARARASRVKALREATRADPPTGAPRIVRGSIPNC